ncbi:MAG: TonB-dependent receptor [Myxococcales bacterium]|nr:TonB-dependent receptor [Myxococcales bacterium]
MSEDVGDDVGDLTAAGPDDEDLVLAARKSRTTVQEAPSIIYVVTKEQIAERGYRSINDVLRTVPGFEGDRWEGNGWERTSFSRGIPHGVLVLWNGVNIVEPLRNYVSLDRKIPLEIVERIEVTSGPGGVLWGSNALLGIVNIVTKHPEDKGLTAVVGAGDGPGDRLALKAGLGYDARFGEDVGLTLYVDFFSSMGPELRLDAQKVIGSLPEPADDSPTIYVPEAVTLSSGQRDWFLNIAGRLEIGPVALDWMIPFEEDHRAIATGGAPLRVNFLDPAQKGEASTSSDSVRVVQLSYRDRFAEDKVGVLARAYVAQWLVNDDPFGVYPASPVVLANLGYTQDLRLKLIGDVIVRPGVAVDVDYGVGDDLKLLAGGELFFDINRGVDQTSWAPATEGQCPTGFTYDPYDTHLPCRIVDRLIDDVTRAIGGGFVQADWRVLPELALSAGVRLQASSQFDPALLWSGGAVWRVADRTHLKLFASSGLRPPGTASTNVRDTTSSITFKANPDLGAETSTSFELEANTMLLRDAGVVRDLYLRANASYTLMDNVIGRPGGRYENSAQLDIIGAEAYARLRFQAGHEVWANYTYTRVFDDRQPSGEIQNISNHMVNLGGKVGFLDDHIELMGLLTYKSAMVDPNRPPLVDPSRPDYSQSCANILASGVASDDPLRQICSFPTLSGAVIVLPGQVVRETLDPVLLLDFGVRFRNIWRDLTVAVFVHNALDYRYYEPDNDGDARVISRPQPKPGMSFFGQISFGL